MTPEAMRCFGRVRVGGVELFAQHGPPRVVRVPADVAAEVRHHATTPGGLAQLADLVGLQMGQHGESDVRACVLGALESGDLAYVVLTDFAPLGLFVVPEPAMVDLRELAEPEPTPTRYAIELQLTDQDGAPVGRIAYQLTLPDGSVEEGMLNDEGTARVSGLTSDAPCEVCFPTLDAQAWSYVHATPL